MPETINFETREKIIKEIPELKQCFQCGTCTSSCPAKIYSGHFSPREFVLECLHGMQNKIINDDLWKCLTCNNCNERCPQDVNPYEVIVKLKNIAIRDNLISPENKEKITSAYNHLIQTGNAYPESELTQKQRKELGLKETKNNTDLKKIIHS